MELAITDVDAEQAQIKFEEYRAAVREHHDAEDAAMMRAYREVTRGNNVISLSATLQAGGRDELGLPRLAVCRADAPKCWLEWCTYDGAVRFVTRPQYQRGYSRSANNRRDVRDFPAGTLRAIEPPEDRIAASSLQIDVRLWDGSLTWGGNRCTVVPSVPPSLRPRHALGGYDILFEVEEWEIDPKVPVDPALLKHMGGDLYAVLAVWDLTDLERLVLRGRAES